MHWSIILMYIWYLFYCLRSRTTTDCAYEDTPLRGSQPAAHHESECGTPCWMFQSYVLNIVKNNFQFYN